MLFAASAFFSVARSTEDGCIPVVGVESFTEEYLTNMCPETDYNTDKTINAKICPNSMDPLTGMAYDVFEDTKAAREYSLKLAILNQMYSDSDNPASCDYYCMYDPLNLGTDTRLAFIYRDSEDKMCWDLADEWSCFTLGYDEYLHAKNKVSRMCSIDSLTPPTGGELEAPSCMRKVPVEMYTEEYLSTLCPAGNTRATGGTYKDYNAVICPGSKDPTTGKVWDVTYASREKRNEGLALALVNQMYTNCASHCMYDTEHLGKEGGMDIAIAYVWRDNMQCWHLASGFGCIDGHAKGEYKTAVAKAKNFCQPKSAAEPVSFDELLTRLENVVKTLRELDAEVGIVPEDDASVEELLKFVTEAELRLVHIKTKMTAEGN